MPSHVIYARKSSESEDRQVLSIDSQIQELKLLALRRGIEAPEILTEAHSAKAPGRPVFGQLMSRVRKNEVAGVSVVTLFDGGRVTHAEGRASEPWWL